jgi:hypothetical protein
MEKVWALAGEIEEREKEEVEESGNERKRQEAKHCCWLIQTGYMAKRVFKL